MKFKTLVVVLALSCATAFGQGRPAGERWIGTWNTALVPLPPAGSQPPTVTAVGVATTAQPAATPSQPAVSAPAPARVRLTLANQTLRQIVHTSIAGERVRVVLSNAFGTAPLTIGAAQIALRSKEADIVRDSARPLLFAGRPGTIIPPAAVMISDAVDLRVPAFSDVAVDIHLPADVTAGPSPLAFHSVGVQTSYVSTTGNHAGMAEFPVVTTTNSWYVLSRIEVVAPAPTVVIATFGDSITDGTRSTPNTNHRWPNTLARRLAKEGGGRYAVLNAGISGNRLLSESGTLGFGPNALARFDRDVLVLPGVTHVVVLEGINDIGGARQNPSPGSDELIAAHRQLIERAHARGLKIIGATLTPFEGAAYFTPEGEAKRTAVNEWIRTSKAYDAVIDFDRVTRDPAQPTRFLKSYDSGDALHPNDAGYEAMGNAIDLALFK